MTMVYSAFQLTDEFFHFCRGDRIERGTGLVHQNDLRFDGQSACDAKSLLLAAGKTVAADVQPIFHFIPKRGGAQTFLDCFVDHERFVIPASANRRRHCRRSISEMDSIFEKPSRHAGGDRPRPRPAR